MFLAYIRGNRCLVIENQWNTNKGKWVAIKYYLINIRFLNKNQDENLYSVRQTKKEADKQDEKINSVIFVI